MRMRSNVERDQRMKFFKKTSVLLSFLLLTANAMGGNGAGGGGFGKTIGLLQTFAYDRAVLTIVGGASLPETELTPKLVIDADEYADFIAEVGKQNAATDSKPLVLTFKDSAGVERSFVLQYVGPQTNEPLVMYLVEQ